MKRERELYRERGKEKEREWGGHVREWNDGYKDIERLCEICGERKRDFGRVREGLWDIWGWRERETGKRE